MSRRRGVVALALATAAAAVAGIGVGGAAAAAEPSARLPPEIAAAWPRAREQGRATMRFLGMRIYDVRLWLAGDARPVARWPHDAATPLALEIEYHRAFDARDIAERSLDEMRRQRAIDAATAERWLARMTAVFPDVEPGDRITGVNVGGAVVRFHVNGRPVGEIADGDFATLFFGIWLSPQTSEPRLRSALLGAAPR